MDKREKILQSAISLFQKQGIEKTTVSDIVSKAKIAQGTFYLYFPSKLALMPAIAEIMVEILVEQMELVLHPSMSTEEKMEAVVDSIFSVNEEYSELLALIYSGLASTEHLKQWESVYEPCYRLISDLLLEAKQAGKIRESLETDRTAKLMIGLIESAAEQVYLYDYPDDEEIVQQKRAVRKFLFDALGLEASSKE